MILKRLWCRPHPIAIPYNLTFWSVWIETELWSKHLDIFHEWRHQEIFIQTQQRFTCKSTENYRVQISTFKNHQGGIWN